VPHDIVEPKTGSKKKLVMQLDRDVQVCGKFLCFSKYSLLLDSPLAFILEGVMLHSIFSMLFDWSTFFLCFLSIYFLQYYKKRNLFELWSIYFWWMDDMFA
jgi:hypothetical protein